LKTTDGGTTWERQNVLPGTKEFKMATYLYAADFRHAPRGVIVGSEGVILRTLDGGGQIDKLAGPTVEVLHGLRFLDDKRGWAVGGEGAILFTSDGGEHWSIQSNIQSP